MLLNSKESTLDKLFTELFKEKHSTDEGEYFLKQNLILINEINLKNSSSDESEEIIKSIRHHFEFYEKLGSDFEVMNKKEFDKFTSTIKSLQSTISTKVTPLIHKLPVDLMVASCSDKLDVLESDLEYSNSVQHKIYLNHDFSSLVDETENHLKLLSHMIYKFEETICSNRNFQPRPLADRKIISICHLYSRLVQNAFPLSLKYEEELNTLECIDDNMPDDATHVQKIICKLVANALYLRGITASSSNKKGSITTTNQVFKLLTREFSW